jgi:diacylglycerol O-acyltransferase
MRRLSGTDALFLAMEKPSWHQHVAGLTILEPGEDSRLSFENFKQTLLERIPLAPKFTWKLKEVPFGLDRPVWVEDEDFDVRRHLRRIAVPGDGGPRETAELISQLLPRQLDRRFPLWEIWYVEGLANGRVGMVMKYHHCLLDGIAGASLATVLLDLEPDPEPSDEPPPAHETAGPDPGDAQLLMQSLPNVAAAPFRVARYGAQLLRRGLTAASFLIGDDSDVASVVNVPRTSFNAQIGPGRAFAFASVSLEDVKALKAEFDVKVNDVVLALCATAIRDYLIDRGELPDRPLISGVPVSTRADGDTAMDNQIATMFVSLATDLEDPIDRLKATYRSTQASKEMTEAVRAKSIQSIGETAPPLLLNLATRAIYDLEILSRMPASVNTLISNVPGPPMALYTCGARVTGIFSTSVILEGMGLNITLLSYIDRIDFGLHVDPELVPDPWQLAEGIPEALTELMKAADLGDPTPVEDAFGFQA